MVEYRISELARRSGFPVSTLRFYEHAGPLPAVRSPGGYRLYGDDALDRLRFIAAGKGLGLALEDIRELLTVWEHGGCAQVRTRLRPLVATRIGEAERRIAELSTFVTALTGVHDDLSGPAPDGPCGPGCGCVSTAPTSTSTSTSTPGPVLLDPTPPRRFPTGSAPAQPTTARTKEMPPACTLTDSEQVGRRDAWADLLGAAITHEETSDGIRVAFPLDPDLAGQLARLAGAEQDCCTFLTFAVAFTPTALIMTVTAPTQARPVLIDLFGAPT